MAFLETIHAAVLTDVTLLSLDAIFERYLGPTLEAAALPRKEE
jgi:hypothetical protein